jgi:hypothetical protein
MTEWYGACYGTKEGVWLIHLFDELGWERPAVPSLREDNQQVIRLSEIGLSGTKTKHVALSYWFVHDVVKKQTLNLVYVDTKLNVADIFTKGLTRIPFERHASALVTQF